FRRSRLCIQRRNYAFWNVLGDHELLRRRRLGAVAHVENAHKGGIENVDRYHAAALRSETSCVTSARMYASLSPRMRAVLIAATSDSGHSTMRRPSRIGRGKSPSPIRV